MTYKWKQFLLPIEVKSGAKGSLKSLHEFMDIAPHTLAIRFLGNRLSIEQAKARQGKLFDLLNLPCFAVSQLEQYIHWYILLVNDFSIPNAIDSLGKNRMVYT